MKISIQKLEEVLKSGVVEVTDAGQSLLVETKMGSFEVAYHALGTFIPKKETPRSEEVVCNLPGNVLAAGVDAALHVLDSRAETRKMVRSADLEGFIPENGC